MPERFIIYYGSTLAKTVADEEMAFGGLVRDHWLGGTSRGLLRGLAIPTRLWRLFWEYVERHSSDHTLWEGALYSTVLALGSTAVAVHYLLHKGSGYKEVFSMAGLKGTWELSAITDGMKLAAAEFKTLLPDISLPLDMVVVVQVRRELLPHARYRDLTFAQDDQDEIEEETPPTVLNAVTLRSGRSYFRPYA